MTNQLVFATHNLNKAREIEALLEGKFYIKTLQEINCTEDIPETGLTLEENALIKARYVYRLFGKNCFADDTGLEVDALNGAPGVFSARFAGEQKSDSANINLLLERLTGESNRKACFRTVIALILDGKEFIFHGVAEGEIQDEKTGSKGFGYDPVFKPIGFNRSFAEMTLEEKNKISHRAHAFAQMKTFLLGL